VPMLNGFNSFKTSNMGAPAMMDYTSLEVATGKFSESNVLGAGGFGCVYKANFDEGVVAAVKRLGVGGHECEKEFEVMIACIKFGIFCFVLGLLLFVRSALTKKSFVIVGFTE
jgi:hypothetical protein